MRPRPPYNCAKTEVKVQRDSMTLIDQEDDLALRLDGLLHASQTPISCGYLSVDSGHEIYFEQFGRTDGIPVVVLHGGPGSGSSPIVRRFFDPSYFRIICFDQRGAGRSQPAGHLEANTTEHLVSDIEALRKHLKISTWLVSGGSWGVTLALAYGISHPQYCLGFLLRSVALGRQSEYEWWTNGMRYFFPESWQRFTNHVSKNERNDLIAAYGKRLCSDDEATSRAAAFEWHRYEGSCGSLLPGKSRKLENSTISELIQMAKIEAHYFMNNAFLEDGWILENKRQITHLPAAIVHGRYDVVCPPMNAYELAEDWPSAKLRIVDASGHQPTEYPLAKAFLEEVKEAKQWCESSTAECGS